MGRDYQKDKNKERLFLIINATKFASGNNEALSRVIRNTGYLGKKLIGIWDIWEKINGMQDISKTELVL